MSTKGDIPTQIEIIGIAGGMGPFAHLDFERKLLESARELMGASRDQDYPEWVVSSVPATPDRTLAFIGEGEDPLPYLERSLLRLQGVAETFQVLRIKGYVAVRGKPMRLMVQGVGPRFRHHFDRTWGASEPRAGVVVVIGESGLDRAAITAAIRA